MCTIILPKLNYSRVPIRRHGTFIRHTPFIRPNTFSKKWAVPFNWISMSKWSTFRYKFVSINLHLLNRPRHMWLIFRPIYFPSGVPLRLFRTPLLIGTREYSFSSHASFSVPKEYTNIVLKCFEKRLFSFSCPFPSWDVNTYPAG